MKRCIRFCDLLDHLTGIEQAAGRQAIGSRQANPPIPIRASTSETAQRAAKECIQLTRLGGLKAAAYRGRSDLYRWLRKRHAKLIEMGVGQKDGPTWEALAKLAAKAGQTNRKGEPPSWNTVRQVWGRVCRDEDAAKASQAKTEAALFPTLRPVPVMARPNPNVPAPIVTPHSRQPEATKDGDTLTALDRTLRRLSGREP